MKPLKVLVCSGNLGNADPSESLHLWIPEDGVSSSLLKNTTKKKYPLVHTLQDFDTIDKSGSSSQNGVQEKDNSDIQDNSNPSRINSSSSERFDIIVIGMQEATWDPSGKNKNNNNLNDDSALMNGSFSNHSSSKEQQQQSTTSEHHPSMLSMNSSIHGAAKKAVKSVGKVAKKGISTANTLSVSRDHTQGAKDLVPDGTTVLHLALKKLLPSYERILSFQRGEMRLLIYASHHHHCHHTMQLQRVKAQNTGGKTGRLANKGGIVAEVRVNNTTTLSFMTCHLEAHEGRDKFKTRCASLASILDGTKKHALPAIYPDISLSNHFCFVLGDLNFRTRLNGSIGVDEQGPQVRQLVAEQDWKQLNAADELFMALDHHHCLTGFQTLCCNFPPPFKVERGSGYDYKTNRTPSYTDRILWNTGNGLEHKIRPLLYEPIDTFQTSDHKPIRAAFEIQLNRPLAFRKKEMIRSLGLFKHPPTEREHLHLYVGDIQCDIFPKSVDSSTPSTYVCLVSNPEEILYLQPTRFQQISHAVQKRIRIRKNNKEVRHISAKGWPRTTVMKKGTLNPNWGINEHVHTILRRHYRDDGRPINLSGAILHLLLFKHNNRQPDEVIGSYPINLDTIYRSVAKADAMTSHQNSRTLHTRQSSGRLQVAFSGASSSRDVNGGGGGSGGILLHPVLSDEHNMVEINVNGPLLKNGNQTGVIRCSLDAWWVDETLGFGGRDADGNSLHLEEGSGNNSGSINSEHSQPSRDSNDSDRRVQATSSSSLRPPSYKRQKQLSQGTSAVPLLIRTTTSTPPAS